MPLTKRINKRLKHKHITFIDVDPQGTIRTLPLHRYRKYRKQFKELFAEPLQYFRGCA